VPSLFTLPGPRPGPDNVMAQQVLEHGFHHVVPHDAAVYASLFRVFWSDHNEIDFTNDGVIWNITSGNVGACVVGFYIWEFVNTGTIVSEATAGNAYGASVLGGGYYFMNSGSIYAIANGNATAVEHWGPGVFVVNSGLVVAYAPSATPPGPNGGGVGSAIGFSLVNGGDFRNESSAAVLAEGVHATAVLMARGSIANYGRLEAVSLTAGEPAYGVRAGGFDFTVNTLVNHGLIKADIAWSSYEAHPLYGPRSIDQLYNMESGRILGDIETGRGADQLVNLGRIEGNVRLGDGNDLFDASLGTLVGFTDLGWDDDVFQGSAAGDVARGNRGADMLIGAGGHDLLLGGTGHDMLAGGDGNDALYGESGNDVLTTAGGDRAFGGDGDDLLAAGDLRFALLSGGAGTDTLRLDVAGIHFDLGAAIATGRLQSIERVALQDSQHIAVRAGDAGALGSTSLAIAGGGANLVNLVGAWVEGPASVRHGAVYRSFLLGGETVFVQMGLPVLAGALLPGFAGLDAIESGPAAPAAGSIAGGDLSSPILTISWRYLQDGTTVIDADETWQSVDAPVLSAESSLAVLENHGVISASTNSNIVYAIQGQYLDRTLNTGTIRATATGTAYATALDPATRGKLENFGRIEASTVAGTAKGATAAWDSDAAVLLNYGAIVAQSSIGAAIGAEITRVYLFQRDPAGANFGLIDAIGGTGTTGLKLLGGGLFVNEGTISARIAPGSGAQEALGVLLYNNGFNVSRLDNRGTISGTVAIRGEGAIEEVVNSGLIIGDVLFNAGDDLLDNRGEIRGAVGLGAGNDLFDSAAGIVQGAVSGGDGADVLIGTAAADTLGGEAGDDVIRGGGGADQLSGGAGRDVFVYTNVGQSTASAYDTIADFVSGTDRIDLSALAVQFFTIEANGGFSVLTAITAAGTLTLRVGGALAAADLVLAHAPTVNGTAGADVLVATAAGSLLAGGGDNDVLIGGGGNDRLDGGGGWDVLVGGEGDDVYVVNGTSDLVRELAGQGTDRIEYDEVAGIYYLPDHVEDLVTLRQSVIRGNDLDNRITGSAEADTLAGGRGSDVLIGGDGDDRLQGDGGADRMTGGAGADRFVFMLLGDSDVGATRPDGRKSTPDLITDFASGQDRIDLSEIDAIAGSQSNDAFTFIGAGAFSGHAGELRIETRGDHIHILGDVDGDGVADLHIMAMAPSIQVVDFIL